MKNKTEKEIYYMLVNRIKQQGQSRPKRHGEYIKLPVYDDYYLDLDTWNSSIYVYKANKYKGSLGINFGGFNCDLRMVNFWLGHIPNVFN